MKSVGIAIQDQGAGIVAVERTPLPGPTTGEREVHFLATEMIRLPYDLPTIAAKVREMDDPEITFEIDAEGIGTALWHVLGGPENPQHFSLYAGRGLERQALVDELLIAVEEGRFNFAPRLPEQSAMTQGLVSYRRQVKEDGLIGSELVVALLLAIRPLPVEGWFIYA